MSKDINVYGVDIELDTIKAEVVAMNDGWLVTLTAVSTEGDVLVAFSESREHATFSEASSEMVGNLAKKIHDWVESVARPAAPVTN